MTTKKKIRRLRETRYGASIRIPIEEKHEAGPRNPGRRMWNLVGRGGAPLHPQRAQGHGHVRRTRRRSTCTLPRCRGRQGAEGGKTVRLPEEYDRQLFEKDFETCLDSCRRLGLKDLETVLRQAYGTEDGEYLFSVVLATLDEPRRLEAERLGMAKERLINTYFQAENEDSGQSAEGKCAEQQE